MTALAISFIVVMVIGVPIVFVLGCSILAYLVFTGQTHLMLVLPQRMFAGVDQFTLLAIPLFVMAGNIMEAGGLTHRLLEFSNSLVGRFRGGMSLTAIWSSFMFGGLSGSAAADAAALGSILIPDMKRQGYHIDYAAALIACCSIMAPLIPPSLAMVIYGALSGTSIARLLIGGIAPAVFLSLFYTIYAIWIAHRRAYPKLPPVSAAGVVRAGLAAIPVLALPLIIIGGIRGGVFTATEAAAVAAVYALLIASIYYRATGVSHLKRAMLETALISSAIYLLIAVANIAAFVFAFERIPQTIVGGLLSISNEHWIVLLLANLVLLLLGMVLDIVGVLILTVPSLMELGQALGMDPVHLGVMVVFNGLLGFIHPPVGLCLFIVAGISKAPVESIALQSLPFLGIALVVLLIVTFSPQIVLFLPNLIVG
jgi:C4-dicarboxylate transporter DctM subunit